jgi:hypothetical protein
MATRNYYTSVVMGPTSFPGFVDSFPGANVALSTARRLKASATLAFRLEDEAASTFVDVGFVGELVDTAAAQAFNPGGNTRVKILYNQADPTNDVTFATAFRPYYKLSGVYYTVGTKPALQADGVLYGSFASGFSVSTSHSIYQVTIFGASNYILAGTNRGIFVGGTAGGAVGPGIFNGTTAITTSNSFEVINTPYFLSSFSSSTTSQYINNNLFSSASGFQLTTLNTLFTRPDATTNALNGRFCELITYSTNEVANQLAMRQNINAFYALY